MDSKLTLWFLTDLTPLTEFPKAYPSRLRPHPLYITFHMPHSADPGLHLHFKFLQFSSLQTSAIFFTPSFTSGFTSSCIHLQSSFCNFICTLLHSAKFCTSLTSRNINASTLDSFITQISHARIGIEMKKFGTSLIWRVFDSTSTLLVFSSCLHTYNSRANRIHKSLNCNDDRRTTTRTMSWLMNVNPRWWLMISKRKIQNWRTRCLDCEEHDDSKYSSKTQSRLESRTNGKREAEIMKVVVEDFLQ